MKYDIDPSYQNNGKFAKGLKIQKLGNGWKKTGKNPVQPVNQILETELVRFSVFGFRFFFPRYLFLFRFQPDIFENGIKLVIFEYSMHITNTL